MDGLEVVPPQEKEVHRVDTGLHQVSESYASPNANEGYPPMTSVSLAQKQEKRICGLRKTTFLIVLLIALLVIGGAVGGGVGGSLANKGGSQSTTSSSSSPDNSTATASTTSTASETSSAPVTSGTTGMAENPCPGRNSTTYELSEDVWVTLLCNVDWPAGEEAADGNGTVMDLYNMTVYTFDACLSQCMTYNEAISGNGSACKAIKYDADLTTALAHGSGNCWLKDRAGKYYPGTDGSMVAG
ncbi:hypothetical protein BJX64DRAFT_48207 [Aspergillus heterothallicus]